MPLRLLCDEHVPLTSLNLLRQAGHDVVAIAETAPSVEDQDVIRMAREEGRLLVTFDSDIGTLLFLHRRPPPPGVVYLRFMQAAPADAAVALFALLQDPARPLEGYYTTVRNGRVRRQRL